VRFIIYGAGAVGGVVGARLHQSGHDVVLIARAAHLAAIQAKGLTLQSPEEAVTLAIPAVGGPERISFRADDAVVMTMKTQDTREALDRLSAAAGPGIPVVCLQNGVVNERMALRRFANVYATTVMLPATHLEPGVVQANAIPRTGVLHTGRYPHGTDAFTAEFTAALSRSNFVAAPDPKPMRQKYTKLLMNLGNAVQAASGIDAATHPIVEAARREGIACFKAAGIDFASDEEERAVRADHYHVAPIAGQRRMGGSTWQSVARGSSSVEVDYLNGEIVLLGRLHGVATPVNGALQELVHRLVGEGRAAGSVPIAALDAIVAGARGGDGTAIPAVR